MMTEREITTADQLIDLLNTLRPDAVTDYDGLPIAAVEIRTTIDGRTVARLRFAGRPIR